MRIHQLSLRGISEAFRERVTVDFASLGPGLIAIVGENGAGKSTLIGSIFAALFRQLPGQKRALYDFCTHPEPEIDLSFSVNGGRHRSLLKLDPKARQMESYIFDSQGAALTSGKKEAYAEWVSKHVGTPSAFLSSIFSSQKRTGNFLSLERSQRKELFITELLGLGRLRLIAASAKGFADQASRRTLALEGEQRGITQLLASESEIEDLGELTRKLDILAVNLQELEEQKSAFDQELQRLQRREVERKSRQEQRQNLRRRIDGTSNEMARLQKQIAEDDRLLAGGKELEGFKEREQAVVLKIEGLHRRIVEAQKLEAANREVEAALRTVEADLRAKRDELNRSRVEATELETVPCQGRGPYAGCIKIQRAMQARQQRPALEGEVATLELERQIQRGALMPITVGSAQLTGRLEDCERERRGLEQLRSHHEELRVAETRRTERASALAKLAQDKSQLETELACADQQLAQLGTLASETEEVRKRAAEVNGSIAAVRSEREGVIARKAQAEQRWRQVEAAKARAALVETELAAARIERDDFDYLAKVFGPDEIQLCEIQSAGPGVSAIANDLLEGCFDNKFEVRFRTQRAKADGRGFTDDFDIEVRNKVLDRTCLVDELSGGQFVLVNEAVNLGIAIYNMRQGEGIPQETLFRDETVGALDAKNAKEYIRMLRHAMSLGGFHQIIFICHTPQIWELADRILCLQNGQVVIESGGTGRNPAI